MSIDDSLHALQARYIAAPQWVRTLVGGAYARLPRRVRFGVGYDDFLRTFLDDDPDALAAYARERLARTLQHALESVPAFADFRGLAPACAADPAAVLRELPLTTKEQIKSSLASYCSTRMPESARLRMFTGGSTSVPMTFYLHKGVSRSREWAAFEAMARRYDTDGPGVVLALRGRTVGSAISETGQLWSYDPVKRHLIVSSDHLEPRHMPRYVEAIKRWNPSYVHAFPSALYPLVAWLREHDLGHLLGKVRGVLLTSESVFDHHLAAFRAFFACPVIVHYGHSERVLFAHTLPDDPRYHFWPHYGQLELVDADGRPVTVPGEVGELVGTSFDNAVMPFVRYRTGDYGVLGGAPHRGLRGYPVIERIEGRMQEFVVCNDRRLISVTTLGAAHFEQLEQCLRIQYEQREPGRLILRVVPLRPLSTDERASIARAAVEKTQGGCTVEVDEVASIELTARGKQRLLIQHLDLAPYLGAAIERTAS